MLYKNIIDSLLPVPIVMKNLSLKLQKNIALSKAYVLQLLCLNVCLFYRGVHSIKRYFIAAMMNLL